MRAIVFTAACGLAASSAALATEPIATDRPDFVESSAVVGAGRAQLETSAAYEWGDPGAASLPTLLRVGAGDAFELRLETPGPVLAEGAVSAEAPEVGVKWRALDDAGAAPAVALLLHDELAPPGGRVSLRAVLEWGLPASFSLGLMPGAGCDRPFHATARCDGLFGAVVGYGVTDRFRVFAESTNEGWRPGAEGASSIDGGFALLLGDDMQLDAAAAAGLTPAAPEAAVTTGFSVRY